LGYPQPSSHVPPHANAVHRLNVGRSPKMPVQVWEGTRIPHASMGVFVPGRCMGKVLRPPCVYGGLCTRVDAWEGYPDLPCVHGVLVPGRCMGKLLGWPCVHGGLCTRSMYGKITRMAMRAWGSLYPVDAWENYSDAHACMGVFVPGQCMVKLVGFP